MTRPTISMADTTPRAAPRRMSSCFVDRGLAGADRARAASGVLKRSRWHSGLEYVIRVMPGELPVATVETNGSQLSRAGGLGGRGRALALNQEARLRVLCGVTVKNPPLCLTLENARIGEGASSTPQQDQRRKRGGKTSRDVSSTHR